MQNYKQIQRAELYIAPNQGFGLYTSLQTTPIEQGTEATVTVVHLCEEGQGVVRALSGHLSDEVLGSVLQQLLLYRVPALQPLGEDQN